MSAKRRVIVLFGGRSAEHDVSRTSAVAVLRAIDQDRFDVIPIGVSLSGDWVRSASADAMLAALRAGADPALLPGQVDVAGHPVDQGSLLPALATASHARTPETSTPPSADELPVVLPVLHGPFGEDGTMQGMLELAGVPYIGAGVLSSALAMDKAAAKEVLHFAGLPQAKWIACAAWDIADPAARASLTTRVAGELAWPVFVKPANLGSSVGVSKAKDAESFIAAIDLALQYDDYLVLEEAIMGREVEFAVLGNEFPEVSVAGEIRAGKEFYDYEDKYLLDSAELLIPAPLTPEQLAEGQALALRAYKALRCEGMARVDFFLDDGSTGGPGRGWVINEANTIPGFTPISMYPKLWEASGLSYSQLLDRLIGLAIARHERRSGRVGRARS